MFSKVLTFTFLFVSAFSANAAILDMGTITRDTTTGLDWLDVTETRGMSYGDVQAQLSSGGSLYGWRYATANELTSLVLNFGYNPVELPCSIADAVICDFEISGDNQIIETMISTLGDTLLDQIPEYVYGDSDVGLTNGFLLSPEALTGTFIKGFIGDFELPSLEGSCQDAEGNIFYGDCDDIVYVGYQSTNLDNPEGRGSFLVRTSAVPIPAAAWLFGSALLGLAGLKRKK